MPQPSVFKGVQDCRLPAFKPLKPFRRPFQGNSCSFPQAFARQLSQLPAGLSKATLAATRPRQCFKPFRKPFQGNSRSYRPQTMLQTLPQAFPRQLSAPGPSHLFLKAFKTAVCPPSNPSMSNPSAGLSWQISQLPAGLSKATLAATRPRQCFKPFRRPFQGNSRSYTPQPSLFKRFKTAVCPPSNPSNPSNPSASLSRNFPQAFPRQLSQLHAPDNASNPSASLSKATLAATRPSHLHLRDSRLPFARPQTPQTLQTLPQAFSKATRAASRRPFQGHSRSYRPQIMLQTLPQAFPRQLSQLQAPAICF